MLNDTRMQDGSVLSLAGVRAGDAVVAVDGQRFCSPNEFMDLVRTRPNVGVQYVRLPEVPAGELEVYKAVRQPFYRHDPSIAPPPARRAECCLSAEWRRWLECRLLAVVVVGQVDWVGLASNLAIMRHISPPVPSLCPHCKVLCNGHTRLVYLMVS
jgi:hypothetical protein